jgi:hypothetical protein
VSDLTDEMRQLAADGATYARPLAVADVIRRGNRRRTRTIAQRSIGGLSAVGLGAAVLFTGAAHHLSGNPAAAGTAVSANTITETSSTTAGDLTMRVKYKYLPHGNIRVESVTYAADTKKAVKKAAALFVFGPGLAPSKKNLFLFIGESSVSHAGHHFSGSLSAKILSHLAKDGVLAGNGSLRISLGQGLITKPTGKHHINDKSEGGKGVTTGTAKAVNPGLTAVVILTR